MNIETFQTALLISQLICVIAIIPLFSYCFIQNNKMDKLVAQVPDNQTVDKANMPAAYYIALGGFIAFMIGVAGFNLLVPVGLNETPHLLIICANFFSIIVGTAALSITVKVFLQNVNIVKNRAIALINKDILHVT
jgi:hypothetical protein